MVKTKDVTRPQTQGNVPAALLKNAAGGIGLNGRNVLADASEVVGGALDVLDGVVEAGQRALGNVATTLGADHGGEGDCHDGSELHDDGISSQYVWLGGV